MFIKVHVRIIDNIKFEEILKDILKYYNENKPKENEPLEILDRAEGGFQIQITNMKHKLCDANEKIKQLRWYKGYLTTTFYNSSYISFSEKELLLLYNSLKYVLVDHNVSLESNII